jgi:hypothetical protein
MKHLFAFSLALLSFTASLRADLLLQAEGFAETGGWVVDAQFMDQMGSPYLLAHGLGKPVKDAVTSFENAEKAQFRLWVRTKNWTARWKVPGAPGRFQVLFNGEVVKETFGTKGDTWQWQDGGVVELPKGKVEVRLKDLTGFAGRCDAIWLSEDLEATPKENLSFQRKTPVEGPDQNTQEKDMGKYDLVVVGGGIAGMCASIRAAEEGLKVALIQNRPVLGGNNSSEIRVPLAGKTALPPYPKLGSVVEELDKANDVQKLVRMDLEKNIDLFLEHHMNAVQNEGERIKYVFAQHIRTGERKRFEADFFADCTGDATLGYLAGADFRIGRESRSETGETKAPEEADHVFLGATLHWSSKKVSNATTFPKCEWALQFNEKTFMNAFGSSWNWEAGYRYDMIKDAEYIRDYLFRVIYGNWAYQKNHVERFKNAELSWLAYVLGKRESRRLMGDVIVKEQDILQDRKFPDGCVASSWGIDLHGPDPKNSKYFPGEEFIAKADHSGKGKQPFVTPYRSFYSRNIPNLFMAGRNISVTHVALGHVRVMKTTGTMGEVVGLAASICKKQNCTPREVYSKHWEKLVKLFEK